MSETAPTATDAGKGPDREHGDVLARAGTVEESRCCGAGWRRAPRRKQLAEAAHRPREQLGSGGRGRERVARSRP